MTELVVSLCVSKKKFHFLSLGRDSFFIQTACKQQLEWILFFQPLALHTPLSFPSEAAAHHDRTRLCHSAERSLAAHQHLHSQRHLQFAAPIAPSQRQEQRENNKQNKQKSQFAVFLISFFIDWSQSN